MSPQESIELAHVRSAMEGLAAGHVTGDLSPLHFLHSTAAVLRRWGAAQEQLNARIDAAAHRRRETEGWLKALRQRPTPLLGSRDAAALAASARDAEAALDAARREEEELRRHCPDRDLIVEFRRERAPAMLAPMLERAAAAAERKARSLLGEMRGTAQAVLTAVDSAVEAHRLACEIAGQELPAPTVSLRHREALEDIARGG